MAPKTEAKPSTTTEEFRLSGRNFKKEASELTKQLTAELKTAFSRILQEAKIRRVIVKKEKKDAKGKVMNEEILVNLPLEVAGALGIVGIIVAPIVTLIVAAGAIAADLDLVVIVEKEIQKSTS